MFGVHATNNAATKSIHVVGQRGEQWNGMLCVGGGRQDCIDARSYYMAVSVV